MTIPATLLRITAHHRVTGPAVVAQFRAAVAEHGTPASTLTDIQDGCVPGSARVVRPVV